MMMTTITINIPPPLAPIAIHFQCMSSGSSVPTDGKEKQTPKGKIKLRFPQKQCEINKNLDNRYRKINVATSHVIVIKVKLILIDNICLNHHFSKGCKGWRAIDLKKTLDFQRKRKNCGIFVLHNGGQKEFACPVF